MMLKPESPEITDPVCLARSSKDLKPLRTPEDARRIRVVLCRPCGSRNVGSVCRAMGSMGYSTLSIVGRAKESFQRSQVAAMGVTSAYLFDEAQFLPTLDSITADCSLVVGLTRRRGSRRKYFSLTPDQLSRRIAHTPGPVALLFGNERVGLNNEELGYCNLACHIPTHPQQPSLNLSHSVQIILYELSKLQNHNSGLSPLSQREVTGLSVQLTQHMRAMGLVDRLGNQLTETFLRDILSRARLSRRESQRLLRMFQTLRYNKVPNDPDNSKPHGNHDDEAPQDTPQDTLGKP